MKLHSNPHRPRSILVGLLALTLMFSMLPTAFAAQQNSYHDPAEHWLTANNRTNELDVNAVVTHETFNCGVCGKQTSFTAWRTPEYSRDGKTALTRNVMYSDGTLLGGEGKGVILDGTPGKDAYYTGYHWTKAMCDTCGTMNSNGSVNGYGFGRNVYNLYDCAAEFMEDLDKRVTYEYADDTYHTVTTKGGSYCCFCYGTIYESSSKLERHSMVTEVLPQPANGRFAVVEKCGLCDYTHYDYTAAKAVIADYYGVVDGKSHTITVSDLSEAGVRTAIRYGNSADSCTMTSAPNYTEAGQYTVYYEITYTYKGKEMTENGSAKVWLRDESTKEDGSCACGCGNPNCGCQNKNCNGNCCADKGCGENHKYILLDSTKAGCTTLGYDRYLCTECGKIEKRDYVDSLGHTWQSIVIRDATCETDGKLLELCARCGEMKQTATPKGEHKYRTYPVAATCTNPGYTVRECSVCGERHIEDITAALPHNYESHVIAATCENGGKTIHRCDGCGSSFVTDYTDALGHSWDEGTLVTNATCTGEGVMEYHCTRCGYHRIEGNEAAGHVPGDAATCTQPQLCTKCGAVLKNALGHDYKFDVTAPTCTEMGYTTNTCTRCGDTNKSDYTAPAGHKPGDWIIDKQPTTDSEGSKHRECENCGEKLETAEIEKIYSSGTTDSKGEAVVGGYLVTVTDTDTSNPVANAAVALHKDNSISIRLPNSRLLDYNDQTTVTVQLVKDKSAVPDISIAVTDKNDNYAADKTNKVGQITVPTGSGKTNEDGKVTGGYEDADGDRWTLTVKVIRTDTKRPISGSEVSIGKTRYHIKPNLLQMNASYVCSDPKGTVVEEVGQVLIKKGHYKLKILNTIDFSASMHYNPFHYLHSETDILSLVTVIMANTQSKEKGGDDFWQQATALLLQALIAYIYYEAPEEEKNFAMLLDMLNACECREGDENFKSPVDLLFDKLAKREPDHFAVKQYTKFRQAAGKTLKSILISCSAALAPFDIQEVRDMMAYVHQAHHQPRDRY